MTDPNPIEPRGCPTPGACSAVEVIERLQKENAEFELIFRCRQDADERAIRLWREAHPGNDLVWPDHADMVTWMLDMVMGMLEERNRLRKEIDALRELADRSAAAFTASLRHIAEQGQEEK